MTQKYIVRLSKEEREVLFQLLKEGRASKKNTTGLVSTPLFPLMFLR
ncbi:MAG: hypothetical protein NTZ52_01950 [Chlamydiae bacterium]|nr:hypothetical protein [Chlamydiota bacterium]